jgi:hypothetical protein
LDTCIPYTPQPRSMATAFRYAAWVFDRLGYSFRHYGIVYHDFHPRHDVGFTCDVFNLCACAAVETYHSIFPHILASFCTLYRARIFGASGIFGLVEGYSMKMLWSNKSLQTTRDGALSSASRLTSFGPACLSF